MLSNVSSHRSQRTDVPGSFGSVWHLRCLISLYLLLYSLPQMLHFAVPLEWIYSMCGFNFVFSIRWQIGHFTRNPWCTLNIWFSYSLLSSNEWLSHKLHSYWWIFWWDSFKCVLKLNSLKLFSHFGHCCRLISCLSSTWFRASCRVLKSVSSSHSSQQNR